MQWDIVSTCPKSTDFLLFLCISALPCLPSQAETPELMPGDFPYPRNKPSGTCVTGGFVSSFHFFIGSRVNHLHILPFQRLKYPDAFSPILAATIRKSSCRAVRYAQFCQ